MIVFCWHLWRRGSSLSLAILSGYFALAVSNALGFSTVTVW
jgi:hypothetical protein